MFYKSSHAPVQYKIPKSLFRRNWKLLAKYITISDDSCIVKSLKPVSNLLIHIL